MCFRHGLLHRVKIGGVPTTPDLILLQKYRDTNGRRIVIQIGGAYTTFCQEEGILLQKYRDRNGRCIAILFKSIGVRGRFDSPDKKLRNRNKRKLTANTPKINAKFRRCIDLAQLSKGISAERRWELLSTNKSPRWLRVIARSKLAQIKSFAKNNQQFMDNYLIYENALVRKQLLS